MSRIMVGPSIKGKILVHSWTTVVTVRIKSVLVADLLLISIIKENPFPRVHPSVGSGVAVASAQVARA